METRPGSGTSIKLSDNGKWSPFVPSQWYMSSLFAKNLPTKQKTGSATSNPMNTSLFCPFASVSLLVYLGVYAFLGQFNPFAGKISDPWGFITSRYGLSAHWLNDNRFGPFYTNPPVWEAFPSRVGSWKKPTLAPSRSSGMI
ncbi:hypothetical protein DSO57_1039220 [Entomophthora muscae]|uniref:Uncharacterized protein n=1 Tax=Entomophthora muscae TaxID=34485 RepID=A0ACC2SMY5_9FUNG|nr:hypothetical protein DSO57_1039220 [Entomophthora muscae]